MENKKLGDDFDLGEMEKIRTDNNMSSYGDSDDSLDKYTEVAAGPQGDIYVYMYVCIYVYVYIYTHTHTHTHTRTHTHTHTHTHTRCMETRMTQLRNTLKLLLDLRVIYMYICMLDLRVIYMYICMYLYVCINAYVCMYTHTHTHTHTRTHTYVVWRLG